MIKKKIALITGITGQDGSYLADLLLSKNYVVHGIKRRSSSFNTERINHIYQSPEKKRRNFILHYGDLTDSISLNNLISKILPDEIYNLAAQSHVAVSFDLPEYTSNVNALGALRILETIKLLKNKKKIKFYQASTSELYGRTKKVPQNENTPFNPASPYAISKLYAYWISKNYRESYDIFACNGILFNHESPRRGETFVTRKITREFCKIHKGLSKCLYIGNLYSKRDWGHARDYAEMQWLMLQQKKPKDYVISTGKQYTVKKFIEICAQILGLKLSWRYKGIKEEAFVKKIIHSKYTNSNIKAGDVVVKVDKKYFRVLEVENLLGDSKKAARELNWKSKTNIKDLAKEMIEFDYKNVT